MSYTIKFRSEARDDYKEAIAYYDSFSNQIGDKFIATIDIVLDRLKIFPFSYPILEQEVRKAVVPNYPYVLLYFIETTTITIISVFNTKQNPTKWLERYT